MPKTIEETINDIAGDTPAEVETQEPVSDSDEDSEDETEEVGADDTDDDDSADDEEDEEEEDASDEDDEESGDSPLIDAKVKDALKDQPEALKILERQEKGFKKAIQRNRELQPLADIHQQLLREDTHGPTMKQIIERNADALGLEVNDYLAFCWGEQVEPAEDDRVARLEREIAQMRTESQKQAQASEETRYVEKIAPKVIKQAKTELNGFGVTQKMIASALRDYPQHRDDPLRAIKAKYSDQIIKHSTAVAKGLKGAGHMLPDSTRSKGERVQPGSLKDMSLNRAIDTLADAF